MNEMVLPWTEKYRPKSVKEVGGHEKETKQILKMIESKNIPNILLVGPPGLGKTTLARAILRDILGEENMYSAVKELNASDKRKIEDMRELIVPFVQNKPFGLPFKAMILDECEKITEDSQYLLKPVLETPTTRFILCANDDSPLIEPITSRCKVYHLKPLSLEYCTKYMKYVTDSEKVKVEDGVFELIYENTLGDLRKCINILQASVGNDNTIRKDDVIERLEIPDETSIEELLIVGTTQSYTDLSSRLTKMIFGSGWSSDKIVKAISRYLTKSSCKLSERTKLLLQEKLLEIAPFDKEIQLNSVMAYLSRVSKEQSSNTTTRMFKCPKCGNLVANGTSKCEKCGATLSWKH